jgi:hypothetical protein
LWLLKQTVEAHSAVSRRNLSTSLLAQGKLPDGCRDSEALAYFAATPLLSRVISGALLVWSAEAAAAERQEVEMARLLRAVSDRGQTHTK